MLVNDFLLNKTLINRVGFLQFTNITINVMYTAFIVYDHLLMMLAISHLFKIIGFPFYDKAMSLYTSNEYNVKKI